MFASTFPQYGIGVLGPVLRRELGFGEATLGFLAASIYLSASFVARYGGRHLDRVAGRSALGLVYGSSVICLLLIAASRSFALLLVATLFAGVAMGVNNPITNRLIAQYVRPGRRGLVIGVKQTGVKVAHLLSGVLIPLFAVTVGWRAGMAAVSAVILAALMVGVAVVPRRGALSLRDLGTPVAAARARVGWLRYFAGAMAIGMAAITTYLPLYAVERVGLPLTQAGLVVSMFALSATLARMLWATIAERLGNPTGVLLLLSGGGAVGLIILALAEAGGVAFLWLGALVTGTTAGSWNVVVQLTVVSEVEPEHAAAATGIVQSAFLLGLAVGAPLFGLLVETTSSFQVAWGASVVLSGAAFTVAARERGRLARAA